MADIFLFPQKMHTFANIIIHRLKLGMKVHREGTGILLTLFTILFVVNVALYYSSGRSTLFYTVCCLSSIFFLLVLNFFRSPFRRFPYDSEGLVIAPADGTIVAIEEVMENEILHEKRLQVSIFMSVFNVHANWFPVEGKVKFVRHEDGNYHKAWLPKASEENEHADIMIETPDGTEVLCRQIAGAMARRIVTYAKDNEECYIDEHLGFIKLGSRVDVYLPLGTEVCVKMGQSTVGDQTVIARLK